MAWQQDNQAPTQPMGMAFMFKGGMVAIGFTLILTLILAFLIQFTPMRETNLPVGGIVIVVLSTMAGGWFAAKQAGNRGLWNGLGVGIIFAVFALLITLVFYSDAFTWVGLLKKAIWSGLGGVLGGVLGVGSAR